MLIKALLPLIAALKFKDNGHRGEHFGQEIANVYKACKAEISRPPKPAEADSKSH